MLYSASWYESYSSSNGKTEMLFLQNHVLRLIVGLFCLFCFLTLDYRYLKRIAAHSRNLVSSIVNPFERIGYPE